MTVKKLPVTFWLLVVGCRVRKNKLSFVIIVIFVFACSRLSYGCSVENSLHKGVLYCKLRL